MNPETAQALKDKLLALADDELILAHRNSEWTGHAPILEEDIAFSNIAQDELGHATLWYSLLTELATGTQPDELVFYRNAAAYRNVQLVELPKGDWAFSMLRQYLFDAYELVLLRCLLASRYGPLAEAAAKMRPEELYHYRHTSNWIKRLGLGTAESHRRTQGALDRLWPYAAQLFTAPPGEERLVTAGYVPQVEEVREAWLAVVSPFLKEAGLRLLAETTSWSGGRDEHTEYLAPLLADLQEVARLYPEAEW
jgi:ring-1,2-phenylacetyl-CoA epoxidase subunit PaaC